jgi:hypothetical protein
MKVTEKLKDNYIPYKVYEDIDPKFKNFVKFVRVLPADYFDNPDEHLTLKGMYIPGDKKSFPNGGFEVYHDNGTIYNYDLDQVIVHPYVLGIKKFGQKSEEKEKVFKIVENKEPGKKGRKPLSDDERVKREQEKIERKSKSSGKKGRPSKYTPEQREAKLAQTNAKKGGKRGRPKKNK